MSTAPTDDSLGDLLARVKSDATAYVGAELKLIGARAGAKVRAVQWAAIMGVLAALIAGATLNALMVGLILIVAGMRGAGWGTLAVVVGGLVVAGLLGWLCASGFKRGMKGGAA